MDILNFKRIALRFISYSGTKFFLRFSGLRTPNWILKSYYFDSRTSFDGPLTAARGKLFNANTKTWRWHRQSARVVSPERETSSSPFFLSERKFTSQEDAGTRRASEEGRDRNRKKSASKHAPRSDPRIIWLWHHSAIVEDCRGEAQATAEALINQQESQTKWTLWRIIYHETRPKYHTIKSTKSQYDISRRSRRDSGRCRRF